MSAQGTRYLFTGGGTGGHVTPNLALIAAIRAADPAAKCLYLGKHDGYEGTRLPPDIPFAGIPCAPFAGPRRAAAFARLAICVLAGVLKAAWHIARFRPRVVIASGGYVSVPVVIAARILRRRVYIHEQNVHPGRANRLLAHLADRAGVAFEATVSRMPAGKAVVAGYPVRGQIAEGSKSRARKRLSIDPQNRVVLVVGGSMGSRAINRAIVEALPALLRIPGLTIVHSTGLSKTSAYHALEDTRARLARAELPETVEGRYFCREFFEDIQDLYALADLVVARSGAGTVMELAAIGKPSILIPKSDVPGDHQLMNALALQRIGAAEVVYEERSEEDGVPVTRVWGDALARKIKEMLDNEAELAEMGARASALAVRDSTERHMREIAALSGEAPSLATEQIAETAGFLADERGSRTELLFSRNTLGCSPFDDIRLPGHSPAARALIVRSRTPEGVRFQVVRKSGRVELDGEPVEGAAEITPPAELVVGAGRYRLVTEEVVRTRAATGGGVGLRILVTGLGTFASRASGFVRSALMAAMFGLGAVTDLFVLGLTIANFLRGVFAEMAVDTAFLPTFIHLQRTGQRERARNLYQSALTITVILSGAATIAGILTLPMWMPAVPGLVSRGLLPEAILLTSVMLPYLVLIAVAALISAVLKAANRFGVPAFSSVMFNAGIIIGCLLYPFFGIASLGAGVLLGGAGQILVQIPSLLSPEVRQAYGIRFRPRLGLSDPAVKKVGRVAPNILADVSISKAGSLVDIVLAMPMAAGMVSALNWALIVFHLPFGLISQSINTVILKEISDRQSLQHRDSVGRLLVSGINWHLFLLLPVTALFIILARPLVDLVFGFGKFSPEAAANVALALRCYAIGLAGWGLTALFGRFFSARMEQNRSTATSALALATNVGISVGLVSLGLGIAGLAIGTSISFLLCAALRLFMLLSSLRAEGVNVNARDLRRSAVKTSLATLGSAIAMLLSYQAVSGFHGAPVFLSRLFVFTVPLVFGAFAYLAAARILNCSELEDVLLRMRRNRAKPSGGDSAPVNPYCITSPQRLLAYVKRAPAGWCDGQRLARRVEIFLRSANWEDRNIAVKLAGELKLKTLREDLVHILSDRTPAPRSHRILGGDFHHPGFVRRNAVVALLALGEPDATTWDALLLALRDPYYEVRTEAARAFAAVGSRLDPPCRERAMESLSAEALSRRNFEVARESVLALGSIAPDDGVVELFRKLHYHRNWRVRDAVILGYERLFERGVLQDSGRLLALLDDVLTTSEGFRPAFEIKEHLARLQRRLLQKREEAPARPPAPAEIRSQPPAASRQGEAEGRPVAGGAPSEAEAIA